MIRAERQNADRTFRIAGRKLRFIASITPDDLAAYEDGFTVNKSSAENLKALDTFILSFLDEDSRATWKEARAVRGDDAIQLDDMLGIVKHVTEVTSGRPTELSGVSTGPVSGAGTISRDASSSTEGAGSEK